MKKLLVVMLALVAASLFATGVEEGTTIRVLMTEPAPFQDGTDIRLYAEAALA